MTGRLCIHTSLRRGLGERRFRGWRGRSRMPLGRSGLLTQRAGSLGNGRSGRRSLSSGCAHSSIKVRRGPASMQSRIRPFSVSSAKSQFPPARHD